ncbi:hypothetical protein FOCC_FOCC005541 [Frankliniella occidentalis]|nr:hypothetical protein FOCC_FOCC005541 [Frankliniella occidentalis]
MTECPTDKSDRNVERPNAYAATTKSLAGLTSTGAETQVKDLADSADSSDPSDPSTKHGSLVSEASKLHPIPLLLLALCIFIMENACLLFEAMDALMITKHLLSNYKEAMKRLKHAAKHCFAIAKDQALQGTVKITSWDSKNEEFYIDTGCPPYPSVTYIVIVILYPIQSRYTSVIPGFPRYAMHGDQSRGVFNLRISNASLEDDAEFQCQVSPKGRTAAIRANATLTVLCKCYPSREGGSYAEPAPPSGVACVPHSCRGVYLLIAFKYAMVAVEARLGVVSAQEKFYFHHFRHRSNSYRT